MRLGLCITAEVAGECPRWVISGHQFGLEPIGAMTLYVIIGRRIPLSANSPTCSTVTALSTASRTRGLMRIWPGLASSQSRDATFDTVPIADLILMRGVRC